MFMIAPYKNQKVMSLFRMLPAIFCTLNVIIAIMDVVKRADGVAVYAIDHDGHFFS